MTRQELIEGIVEALSGDLAVVLAKKLRDAVATKNNKEAHKIIKHVDYLHNVTGDYTPTERFRQPWVPEVNTYPFAPRHVHSNTGYRVQKV